jgi:hypothetical protein
MFGQEYKLWSSSLCSFLHSPVTSSLLLFEVAVSIFVWRYSNHKNIREDSPISQLTFKTKSQEKKFRRQIRKINLHLVPKFRMLGVTLPLSHGFMVFV